MFLVYNGAVAWGRGGSISKISTVFILYGERVFSELSITDEQIEPSFIIHHESQAKPRNIIYLIHAI